MIFKEISKLSGEERERILLRARDIAPELVKSIIEDVRERGDRAVKEYTKRFDGAELEELRVGERELEEAERKAERRLVERLREAHRNILSYHRRQLDEGWWYEEDGRRLGQITRPVPSVGCYVPGGRAYYPSTVLMAVAPARVAGVRRIACTTPPRRDGTVNEHILLACKIAGVDEIYKVGGAQAIAALAYGTESIERVDMIAGPGNIYVTAAKKAVYGDVGVDMLAGPSEVLIIADSTAAPEHIASDILAQAEHDPQARCVLVSIDRRLAEEVWSRLQGLGASAPEALEKAVVLLARSLEEAVEFSNQYAPEHLEIMVQEEQRALEMVENAGSIFLGPYSPVAAGDYATGPNHILPTGGSARFHSGLTVWHFMRRISVQRLTKRGLASIAGAVIELAEAEGLPYHAESVRKRL